MVVEKGVDSSQQWRDKHTRSAALAVTYPLHTGVPSAAKMLATRLGRVCAPRARHLSSNDLKFFAGVPEVTKDGVAIIRLDNKSQKMNTLSPALQDEAKMLWKELTSKHDVKAAVFISAKPDNFIAGADIGMLAAKKKSGERIPYGPSV